MIILTDEEGKEVIEAFSELERLSYMCGLQPRKALTNDIQELAHKMFVKLSKREALHKAHPPALKIDTGDCREKAPRKVFTHEMANYMPTLPMGTDAAGVKDACARYLANMVGVKFREGNSVE